jgi:peroxiredoxin
MNKKIKILLIALTIIIGWQSSLVFGQFIQKKNLAPAFTLKDLQGNTFSFTNKLKKPLLLFFGTTWCPYCRKEIPAYKKIYETYSPQGLEIVYINIMEPSAKVAKFASANSLPYKVLLDEDGSVADSYHVRGVPTLILIDKTGVIFSESNQVMDLPLNKLFPAKK